MFRKTVSRLMRRMSFDPATARGRQWSAGSLLSAYELRRRPRDELQQVVRSLAGGSYLGSDTAVCRILGQYKMLVDTSDYGVSLQLLFEGFWEWWLTELVLREVREGMCVADIGANVGYYTLLMADLVGPAGRVLSFEPNPPIASRLRRSLAINGFDGRTTLHEVALDAAQGESLLAVPPGGPGGAHVIVDTQGRTGVPIPLRRFDAIPGADEVAFIKIDTEGAEPRVWESMRGVLDRGRPLTVVTEFTHARYDDPAAFVRRIRDDGFSLELVDPLGGIRPVTAEQLLAGPGIDEQTLLLRR